MDTIMIAAPPAVVSVRRTLVPGSNPVLGMTGTFVFGAGARTRDAKQAAPPRGELC